MKFDAKTTARAIAAEVPGAAEVFRKVAINFCCQGDVPLEMAAAQAGLDIQKLLDELGALQEAAARHAPESTGDLIDFILSRYHQTHRAELEWLIPLAQKVERVHGGHEEAPHGLAEALLALKSELETHMEKEEKVLFPAMQSANGGNMTGPISRMRHEHDETSDLLETVEHATNGLQLPEGACGSWTALYTGLRKLTDDLISHIYLENSVLFPRFEAGREKGA